MIIIRDVKVTLQSKTKMHIIITREMMEKVLNEKYGMDAEKIKRTKQNKRFKLTHANSIIDFAMEVRSYLTNVIMI